MTFPNLGLMVRGRNGVRPYDVTASSLSMLSQESFLTSPFYQRNRRDGAYQFLHLNLCAAVRSTALSLKI